MKKFFPNSIIGLSDHTTNNLACFGAVALGASILERHFTDSMDRIGPDIVCSMDTNSCKELIDGANILFQERGGNKTLIEEEQVTRDFAFATVVTIEDISVGEIFSKVNIWVKRPGTGEIRAKNFEEILGKKSLKVIPKDTHLKWTDIENFK
jgi:N-acetylneuraminate synthase